MERSARELDELAGALLRPGLRVDTVLGAGSFGTVYRGRQLAVDRDVAIKVLHPWFAPETEPGQLFREEIRAIGQLDHRHVVRIFDADVTEDGRLYFVMELLHGPTLHELAAAGPMSAPRAIALCGQVLEGLAAVHAAGRIHADVKPSNVIVASGDTAERAVLIDFGLSRLRRPGQEAVGGTRAFMAPEQLERWQLEERSDVYSAGLLLLRLLTGWQRGDSEHQPLTADDLNATPPLHLVDDPALRVALERALAEEPSARPSATDLARALRGGVAEEPGAAAPPPPFRKLAPLTERDRGRLRGRRAETRQLARSLEPERALVLTAASGTGKTSLLRAGLQPYLDAQGVDSVYVACSAGAAPAIAEAIESVRAAATEGTGGAAASAGSEASHHGDPEQDRGARAERNGSTPASLHANASPGAIRAAIARWHARSPRRLVLILDQVEALLASPALAASVLEELLAVERRPPGADLAILLSVREDFVARMLALSDVLSRGVPQLRLAPLDRQGAHAALVEPLAEHGLALSEELRERLLDDLQRAGLAHGAELGWRAEAAIYPPHLQLAGDALVTALAADERELTVDHYQRLGGFEAIVGDSLERILGELSASEAEIARALFLALVGVAQLRAVRSDEELRARVGERHGDPDVARVLQRLESHRLIARRLGTDGTTAWELVHDSLIPRIERWLTVHDLDRRRAAEGLRFHLRESSAEVPSLLGAGELRRLARFPGLVEELEEEWRRRASAAWTPQRLIERSWLVLRYRHGVAAAVGALVLGLSALLAITWLGDRAARQREATLRDRDLGLLDVSLRPFTWRRAADDLVAVDVDAAELPHLTWSLHDPDDQDSTAPGAPVPPERVRRGRRELRGGALVELGVEARGGDAVLVISGRGRGGAVCPSSSVPLRRVPGYAHRAAGARRLDIPVPTCDASREDTVEIPAGPFVAGGLGEPPPPGYDAADFPAERAARWLAAYRIDRTELTNAAFSVFARLAPITGLVFVDYPPNLAYAAGSRYPRTDLNAFDAEAFCRFLGKRLPTSDQWLKALRGGLTLADGSPNPMPRRNLPWGAPTAPAPTNLADTGGLRVAPVDAFPEDRSPYGVLGLAGNVQEWTRSPADELSATSDLPVQQRARISRGGNWFQTRSVDLLAYLATENPRSPRQVNYFQGARCVEEP